MKKTIYGKWSRLLIASLVLITLLMTAPAAIMAQDNNTTGCCPDYCKLQVNIVIPDCLPPEIPVDDCPECDVNCDYFEGSPCVYVYEGDTFWVNAVIARPDGVDEPIENVYAAICLEGGFRPAFTVEEAVMIDGPNACLVECDEVQGPFTLNGCFDVKDIWWKVRCLDAGPVFITVNAWAGDETDGIDLKSTVIEDGCCFGDSDTIVVKQLERPIEYPNLEVEIIECPEEPVMPGDIYGVKARVWNRTDAQIDCVWAYIDICGPAELTNDNPFFWYAGNIRANSSVEVAWMVRCTGNEILNTDSLDLVPYYVSGDVKITVDAWYWGQHRYDETKADFCCVHQIVPAQFLATLNASVEKVGTECNNCFDVTLDVSNLSRYIPIGEVVAELHVEGDAYINNSARVPLNTIPCNESTSYTWQVCCDGTGLVDIWASLTGFDHLFNQEVCFETDSVTISQEYPLMVEVQEPFPYTELSVGQAFDFTYRVTNVQDDGDELDGIWVGLDLGEAPCVALASQVVQVVPDPLTGIQPFTIQASSVNVTESTYEAFLDCMMDCCWADITWQLTCTCSGMCDLPIPQPTITTVTVDSAPNGSLPYGCGDCVPVCPDVITGYAYVDELGGDEDSVTVIQMDPPCLAASIDAYEGAFSIGNFECMTSVKRASDAAVAVGEYFTVVVPVANTGEATAEDVCVSLAANGPAVLVSGNLTVCLGDIPCHGAAKAVWEFQCIGEGAMGFTIGSLIGSDANTGLPIAGDCIDTGCAIFVDQIPLTVEVIQPANCTEFIEGDAFSVKARICNNSTLDIPLNDVYAALRWYGDGDMALAYGQANPVSLDQLSPGECAEATWQVYCCEDGDVTFTIDVWNDCDPYLDIESCPVTIHQFEPGRICCHILSPKLNDYDECREFCEYEAYIATGQEFAVTAKFYNSGDRAFWIEEFGLLAFDEGDIQINGGPYANWPDPANPYRLMPRESVVVSWDVLCTDAGETDLKVYVEGSDDMNGQDSCCSEVKIMQYPAAHLIVEIIDFPTDDIVTGTDFSVTARVTNIGDADAWEVNTTLSVEPAGSVRLSADDATGSYTKNIGNLIGHGVTECEEVTWVLNCKEACNSTITVTATGFDEYGYEVKQICGDYMPGASGNQIVCCELLLDGIPGAPIQSRFIEPDSVTVKQVAASGGQEPIEPEPGDGCVEIQLQAGWNLVSIPWYVPAEDRAPEDLLADILDNLDSVYAYNACDLEFLAYNPDPEVPDFLTEVRDGPGYWVLMDAPDVLVVCDPPAGGTVPPTYSVDCTGYNLIGPRIGEDSMLVSEWLMGLDVAAVLGYNPETDTFFIVHSTDMVEPGQGYWVFFRSPGTRAF